MSEQTSKSNCVHANFIGLAIGVQTLFYRLYILMLFRIQQRQRFSYVSFIRCLDWRIIFYLLLLF